MPSPFHAALQRLPDDDVIHGLLQQSLDRDPTIAIPAIDALLRRAEVVVDRIYVRTFNPRVLGGSDGSSATRHTLYALAAELDMCRARTATEFTLWVSELCSRIVLAALQLGIPVADLTMSQECDASAGAPHGGDEPHRISDFEDEELRIERATRPRTDTPNGCQTAHLVARGSSSKEVELVAQSFTALSPADQIIVTERVLHGATWTAVAASLGITVRTVRRRHARAVATLLRALRYVSASDAA